MSENTGAKSKTGSGVGWRFNAATMIGDVEPAGNYWQVCVYSDSSPVGSKLLCVCYGATQDVALARAKRVMALWNADPATSTNAGGVA